MCAAQNKASDAKGSIKDGDMKSFVPMACMQCKAHNLNCLSRDEESAAKNMEIPKHLFPYLDATEAQAPRLVAKTRSQIVFPVIRNRILRASLRKSPPRKTFESRLVRMES